MLRKACKSQVDDDMKLPLNDFSSNYAKIFEKPYQCQKKVKYMAS